MIVTYIEEHAKHNVRELVEEQFKGTIAYNTECKKCRTKSVREGEYYELELNVKVFGVHFILSYPNLTPKFRGLSLWRTLLRVIFKKKN